MHFYWPTVVVVCICFLATLYHVSVPVRTNWSFNLPGATFSLAVLDRWARYLLRWFLTATAADSRSIYGPLSAPIAVLLWLYLVAIAVLIGAAVNASFDTVFPQKTTTRARLELVQRLRSMTARDRRVTGVTARGTRRLDSAPCRTTIRATSHRASPGARSPSPTGRARRGGSWAAGCWPRWRSWSARC